MLHYTINNGLASNTIYDIYKDPEGFFWLGTDKGISRFNGLTFENFTTADGLSDNECFFFKQDLYGRLWIGTYNGQLCYYKNGIFHNEKNTPWLKIPVAVARTSQITINKDSSISISFCDNPLILEIKNEKKKILTAATTNEKHAEVNMFRYTRKLSEDRYLFVYKYDALIVNFKTGKTEKQVPIYPELKSIASKHGPLILMQKNGVLSTIDDECRLSAFSFINLPESSAFYQLLYSGQDTFFVSNSGIKSNRQEIFKEVKSAFSSYISGNLLLVGTSNKGLFLFDLSGKVRNTLDPQPQGDIDYAQIIGNRLLILNKQSTVSIYRTSDFKKAETIQVRQFNQMASALNFFRDNYFYSLASDTNYRIPLTGSPLKPQPIYDGEFNTSPKNFVDLDTVILMEGRQKICTIKADDLKTKRTMTFKRDLGVRPHFKSLFGFAEESDKNIWVSTIQKIYKVRADSLIPQPQFGNLAFREMLFLQQNLIGITHDNRLVVCHNYRGSAVSADTLSSGDCVWNKLLKLNDSTLFITTNNYPRLLRFFSRSGKNSFRIRTL
ncbi:two-component regulator propeller domain-containing protein, partial [Rurimicrobium arvi]|uniref:two-component regulator propeller domain-containing protein n=1 Tax=Rurimicrobium arvi TaxID=2049916 RepID=UPI0031D157F0